ncbi:MAG: hypothetical protein M1422_00125 [Candidatus Thermoplasmatota archaeon]|nr:hypothetical protein [Candidatus Sysuiplasma jiujiangense]MBX8640149.1 hypothetical protein [Candidatus Sysuiplasma jiujiangense]MBX8642799.1 hypothetical protein [Candidatus Sysuiplasma jiujiangense]MCL4316666.1 hypothetical protein [Candidatus Thermoplasmatota archaeon]
MKRCKSCADISTCPVCGSQITSFSHIGVRGNETAFNVPLIDYRLTISSNPSGIRHYAQPCDHRILVQAASPDIVYNGGPLWGTGYSWINVYWGKFFAAPENSAWIARVDRATSDIETSPGYSGGLRQYNVGIGRLAKSFTVPEDPPSVVTNSQIKEKLASWISSGSITDVGRRGAYNIFLPPGVTVTLSNESSCAYFCDYHDTVDGVNGPFYTVEPYPCSSGCNQCTADAFDTLTMGLSEEMVELKTDMDPGTGWVIGNEEICDYCDAHFVCNKISTGEYVNAWYDKSRNACWAGR